jgi:N6-L-threonylcarbamoyladenine synthase/protein kinase Bud32
VRKLSEGAEAKVFETRIFGIDAVVKTRHAKAYRIKELDEALRITRTRREARAMMRAANSGVNVPRLIGLGRFSIYMEKLGGRLLKDVPGKRASYSDIGEMLAKMHAADVIHGDFTPANVIVRKRKVYVIDFGLSDISNSIEDKAIDLLLMKRSVSEKQYGELSGSYAKAYADSKKIFTRLAEIERRGRYQIRTLA